MRPPLFLQDGRTSAPSPAAEKSKPAATVSVGRGPWRFSIIYRRLAVSQEQPSRKTFGFSPPFPLICTIFGFVQDKLRFGKGKKNVVFLSFSLTLHYLCPAGLLVLPGKR